mmetsp:Transcript_13333/g.18283  ORF Transcript_13333/g.18283 Transcript_13333/m.18283 type:complete len:125 (-) Transcript_13333:125-499(-)
MDATTFSKELSKYKVIRPEDYCKSQIKQKNAVIAAGNKTVLKSTTSTTKQSQETKDSQSVPKSRNDVDVSFWSVFESTLRENSTLSTREITNFINIMRKSERDVIGSVNLEDLETAAAGLLSRS